MQYKHNKLLVPFAKSLRKNMTKEERRFWYEYLRMHPARFTRQKVLGKYIADFYSSQASLVIELDGSQHYEDANLSKDEKRTSFLEKYGLRVIRIQNIDVTRNFSGVCEYLEREINASLNRQSS